MGVLHISCMTTHWYVSSQHYPWVAFTVQRSGHGYPTLDFPVAAIVGEAANGREAIEAVEQHRPDIVLLDVSMPVMNGFEAARVLRERLPETRIIFASQHAESTYVEEAFRLGASGYLLKKAAAAQLPEAVRTVFAGGVFRPPELTM